MFEAVQAVGRIMKDFQRPWFVCGGWALDLFLGHETRPHHDIEIGILRGDQRALQEFLQGWSLEKVLKEPSRLEPWHAGEELQVPVHEAYAKKDGFVLEILLNEHADQDWLFRRNLKVRAPLSALLKYHQGIPYLSPQFVLLYKARDPKEKDKADWRRAFPALTEEARLWLGEAIRVSEGPGHPWGADGTP